MGNIQSLPIDSYLDRHPCSGRNITWHYIHTNGSLPAPYSHCPYASAILSSHCCTHGVCTPGWFDREYERYQYANWDGLGDPCNEITNATIGNWKNGTSNSTAPSWNNRFERPARGGMCLGMEPSLWFVGNHWPPLGLDGMPVEHFRQMKWGNSSVGDEYGQKQAMESNVSARSGRLEHQVVTSGAVQMETITIWKLATYVLVDLKAALWRMGEPMNTVGFFMGILMGYLIYLETNGGLPGPSKPQLSQRRELQTKATGPQTSTAKVNKKKRKSRNTYVASQHSDLQVADVQILPKAAQNGASQINDPLVSNVEVLPQAPWYGASQNNDLQVPYFPVPPQASLDVASQHSDLQVPNDLTPPPTSPPTPAPQNNDAQVSDVPIRLQAPRNGASHDDDFQASLVPVRPQAPQVPINLTPPISPPTPAPNNNYIATGNNSTTPRYNVRERRRRNVDWGSLRRTDNSGSQSTTETSSQQGSQSASPSSQQGSCGASTDSDSQQVGAQHRNPSTRPRQRLS